MVSQANRLRLWAETMTEIFQEEADVDLTNEQRESLAHMFAGAFQAGATFTIKKGESDDTIHCVED